MPRGTSVRKWSVMTLVYSICYTKEMPHLSHYFTSLSNNQNMRVSNPWNICFKWFYMAHVPVLKIWFTEFKVLHFYFWWIECHSVCLWLFVEESRLIFVNVIFFMYFYDFQIIDINNNCLCKACIRELNFSKLNVSMNNAVPFSFMQTSL